MYKSSKVDDERVLKFKEGDSLDLFCHGGSDEYVYYMPEKFHFFSLISSMIGTKRVFM